MLGLVITDVIMAIIACLCFVLSIFAFKGKGPILTNEYLLATYEERKALDVHKLKKDAKEYRYTAILFLGISLMFLTMFIGCLLLLFQINENIMFIVSIIISLLLCIYDIISKLKANA